MNLHVLINYNKYISCNIDDIVLLSSDNTVSLPNTVKSVVIDNLLGYESQEVYYMVNSFFKIIGEKYYPVSNASYVRFFQPITNIIFNVEKIINEEKIDKIYLYGGSSHVFLSSEGAEGEVERKGNYQTNWMVNAILYEKFKDKYCIEWVNKEWAFKSGIRNAIWRWKICISILVMLIKRACLDFGEKTNKMRYNCLNGTISIVDFALQKDHLDKVICSATGRNAKFFTLNKQFAMMCPDTSYIPELSVINYITLWFRTFFRYRKPVSFFGIKNRCILKELDYLLLIYNIRKNRLLRYFEDVDLHKTIMVTDMTYGSDIVSVHSFSKLKGMKHVNIQHVSMGKRLVPNLELADEYFIYAKRTFELFKHYSKSFRFFFPTFNNGNRDNIQKVKPVLVIFLQPGRFLNDYLFLMEHLFPQIKANSCSIVVKPHYRQFDADMEKVYNICDHYNFVRVAQKDEAVVGLLEKADMSLTINSSVIFESMTYGVPSIIYNPQDNYNSIIYNNDICFPDVNFVVNDIQGIVTVLSCVKEYKDMFKERLSIFLTTYGGKNSLLYESLNFV